MSCSHQFTAKYLSRPSPPFPANLCCDMEILGNDGHLYRSVAAKNGVCRWVKVKMTKSVHKKTQRQPKTRKSGRKGKADPLYHVTIEMTASSSLDPPRTITRTQLAKHLRQYFDPIEISQLVDYGHLEWVPNMKLSGTILTFDVPKSISLEMDSIKTAADLERWIKMHSLADSAWESGSSNFFLMLDDKKGDRREVATVMPGQVRVT